MHSPPRPITIVGGGLAGLSLGIALRAADIPVRIVEAGSYPRHKVCGEFIAGLRPETIATLGLRPALADARRHRSLTWQRDGQEFRRDTLADPSYGISRHQLDQRLADQFLAHGGILHCRQRAAEKDFAEEGVVWTAGRARQKSDWIGLKVHAHALPLRADLEMHLGDRAYVGAATVEGDRVNLCGLFAKRPLETGPREATFLAYLQAAGLEDLANRIRAATTDPDSFSSVAALGFGPAPGDDARLRLGDAFALVPPFTGDGMAMAFEGAACALPEIIAYSNGQRDWPTARARTAYALQRRFRVRLAIARLAHPFLLHPRRQRAFQLICAARLFPFARFYQLLH